MQLNTDGLYTNVLAYRDRLEDSLKYLDRNSTSYKVLLVALNDINSIFEDAVIEINDFTVRHTLIKEVIKEQCFKIPTLKEEKQHQQYGWYRKFEKRKF